MREIRVKVLDAPKHVRSVRTYSMMVQADVERITESLNGIEFKNYAISESTLPVMISFRGRH